MHPAICRLLLRVPCTAVLVTGIACGNGIGPLSSGHRVFVTSNENHQLTVVDGATGDVAGRIALPSATETAAFSPDSALLYVTAGDLVAIDTHSLAVRWRETLSTTTNPRPDRWHGVVVAGESAIASSPDGARLFVASAFRADTQGIAVLDAQTRNLITFVGPFFVEGRGLLVVPPGATTPNGRLIVAGRRAAYPFPRVDWLYTVDLSTLVVTDSAAITDVSGGDRYLTLPILAPDGRHVYVMEFGSAVNLCNYDLVTRQVVGSTPLESGRPFGLGPVGATLYQPRPSGSDGAAAELLVYDATLVLRNRISLPEVDGVPPVVSEMTTSPDGARVYLTAGTGSRVLEGATQPGRRVTRRSATILTSGADTRPARRTIRFDPPYPL